ncbi:MAG: hypothetical protein AAF604_09620 [Acidobacteriota bacterium]
MIWTLVILAGVMLMLWLSRRPGKHRRVPQLELEKYLDRLLRSGLEGGLAIIEVPKTEEFIQFKKIFKPNRRFSIELGFPLAPWSTEFYSQVREILESNNWAYFRSSTGDETVREFTLADFGNDVKPAGDCSRLILREAFRLQPEDTVTVLLQSISPRDEVISSPPGKPSSTHHG